MSGKRTGLSFEPQWVDGHTWYYECSGGIEISHEVMDYKVEPPSVVRSIVIRIPWRKLRASLRRKDKQMEKPRGKA